MSLWPRCWAKVRFATAARDRLRMMRVCHLNTCRGVAPRTRGCQLRDRSRAASFRPRMCLANLESQAHHDIMSCTIKPGCAHWKLRVSISRNSFISRMSALKSAASADRDHGLTSRSTSPSKRASLPLRTVKVGTPIRTPTALSAPFSQRDQRPTWLILDETVHLKFHGSAGQSLVPSYRVSR